MYTKQVQGLAAESLFMEVLSCTPDRAKGVPGVVFCECGLTLQEVRYWVMLNGPVYRGPKEEGTDLPGVTGDTR